MIQNGITYNGVKTQGVEKAAWPLVLAGQQGPDEDGGVVNAVDIDWNGGVLPNGDIETGNSVTINTTGELLSLINKMQEEIYVLSAA